jgi:DNA-binding beta-propeller fold protein YncE
VIDTRSGSVATRIEGFGFPYRMAITADGSTGVVTDPGAERVHLVDAKTHRIRSTLEMANLAGLPADAAEHPSPQGITLSRDGTVAFVTLKGAGMVAVIDLAQAKVIKLLTVGGGSDGVGFSPMTSRAKP